MCASRPFAFTWGSGLNVRAQSHRQLQKSFRLFVDEVIYPDAQAREEDGKRPSLEVIAKMAYVAYSPIRC
jgi:hypothetical protein